MFFVLEAITDYCLKQMLGQNYFHKVVSIITVVVWEQKDFMVTDV